MWNLARLAKHPDLAPYFAQVLPIFWPVLYWQLVKMSAQLRAAGCREALGRVTWWGGVYITLLGDKPPSPSAYKPLTPARVHWSDEIWSTALPTGLDTEVGRPILPRKRGRGKSRHKDTKLSPTRNRSPPHSWGGIGWGPSQRNHKHRPAQSCVRPKQLAYPASSALRREKRHPPEAKAPSAAPSTR